MSTVECSARTEQGHTCIRESGHRGAHMCVTGHWWPYTIDGAPYMYTPYTPMAVTA